MRKTFVIGLLICSLGCAKQAKEEDDPDGKQDLAQLLQELQDPKAENRLDAVHEIRERPKKDAEYAQIVPALTALLKDPDEDVRKEAADALGECGKEARDAVKALAELLKDTDKEVRCAAAEALGNIGPEARDAVPALKAARGDKSEDVQQAAAEALESIGEK
jgi:HEAT repeat protein